MNKAQLEELKRLGPSVETPEYKRMQWAWFKINSVLAGTEAMRQAKDLAPQHAGEDDEVYEERLRGTVLENFLSITLETMANRLFRKPVSVGEDVPPQLVEMFKDVDGDGSTLQVFLHDWFQDAFRAGFSYTLTDMPAIREEDKEKRTKADDIAERRWPKWRIIPAENMIEARMAEANGRRVCVMARFWEKYKVYTNDFIVEEKDRVRVLYPGRWETWIDENADQPGRKPKWVINASGTMDTTEVMIEPFYAGKKLGDGECKPSLEDLADLNIRYWQSSSDQTSILTVARFPIMACSGVTQEKGRSLVVVGPRRILSTRDPQGKYYYVEHSGNAIASGTADLDRLAERMGAYGAFFLKKDIVGRTAFANNADNSQMMSPLKNMALRFQDAVACLLDMTAKWLDLKEGGHVQIDLSDTEVDVKGPLLTSLKDARTRGDLSQQTFLEEMIRIKALSPDINVAQEIALTKKEREEGPHLPTFMTASSSLNAIPGLPPSTILLANASMPPAGSGSGESDDEDEDDEEDGAEGKKGRSEDGKGGQGSGDQQDGVKRENAVSKRAVPSAKGRALKKKGATSDGRK